MVEMYKKLSSIVGTMSDDEVDAVFNMSVSLGETHGHIADQFYREFNGEN